MLGWPFTKFIGILTLCSSADILRVMDGKIHDEVHVLSLSIGDPLPLTSSVDDVIGIGACNAMIREIIVVCGAGNCEHIA